MKKILFTVLAVTILSCEKDEVEKTEITNNEECNCGEITETGSMMGSDSTTYHAIIYNECSMMDTTVHYIPQTQAGDNKGAGDLHCLGVNW